MKKILMRIGRRGENGRRRAAAVVEMAVVTPLLLTLVFGIIEFGWTMMVRETMVNAAREGCRTAVLRYQNNTQLETAVRNRVNRTLETINLALDDDVDIEFEHAANPPLAPNDMETVTLSLPLSRISLLGDFFGLGDNTMQTTCTMRKEQ